MRTFAAGLLLLNCLHLLLAYLSGRDVGLSTIHIYPFTAPHLGMLIITVVLLAVSTFKFPPPVSLSVVTSALLVGTFFTAQHGSAGWSGNDAGGMAWTLFIGGFSIVNVICAIVLIVFVVREKLRPSYVRLDREEN